MDNSNRELQAALWGPNQIRKALGAFYKDEPPTNPDSLAQLVPMCLQCNRPIDECEASNVCADDRKEEMLCD